MLAASVLYACATRTSAGLGHLPVGSILSGGASVFAPPAVLQGRQDFAVSQRPRDSLERPFARTSAAEHPLATNAEYVVMTSRWLPPLDSKDSLVVARRGLAPADEELSFRGARYRFHYDGAHVTGTIERPDSAVQRFDHVFEEPLFAFNETDLLVRSLEYRPGLSVVVPLFSEVDRAVEHDTISVLERTSRANGATAWVVRFADPVITTRYLVDARSREILDKETRQRKSGLAFHYVPVNP